MKRLLIAETIHLAPLRERRRGLLLVLGCKPKLLVDLFRYGTQLIKAVKENTLGMPTRISKGVKPQNEVIRMSRHGQFSIREMPRNEVDHVLKASGKSNLVQNRRVRNILIRTNTIVNIMENIVKKGSKGTRSTWMGTKRETWASKTRSSSSGERSRRRGPRNLGSSRRGWKRS